MTNYNERLDKALEQLAVAGRGWGVSESAQIVSMSGELDEAKQALTSLTKELVAEAKPELPALFAGLNDIGVIMYKKGTDEFEQNLLKALSSGKE